MCLIVIAIGKSEKYPFVFLSNRDEFYQRPSEPMHWWDNQDILAGKDLQAGGTWLAISKSGKVAAVTNYRDPQRNDPNAPSRGNIPVDLLNSNTENFQGYVNVKKESWSKMNGFNLIYHDGKTTFHYSNISEEITQMEKGIYGISNALLDSSWPKVIQAKNLLSSSLEKNTIEVDELISILRHTEKHPDHLLPETGVGLEMERMLSPICIQSPIYGTRTHTLVLKDFSGQIFVKEVQALTEDQRDFIW